MEPGVVVRPLAGQIGAALRGIEVSRGVDARDVEVIKTAVAAHGVVVLPDQGVDPGQHLALARSLGEVSPPPDFFDATLADEGFPEITVISTSNNLAYRTNRWHSDLTWKPEPPRYTVLKMHASPAAGGDTLWSSQYRSYETLSGTMQRFLAPLTARHQLTASPFVAGEDLPPPADHPIVLHHEVTGRPALFLNGRFTRKINKLSDQESDALLVMLLKHGERPEFVCRWSWHEGDVAIWDNYFVQHYAVADYQPAFREVHRVHVLGGHAPSTLARTSDSAGGELQDVTVP